ncbi:MAG: type II toxin-antitoxin system RelE/ParE family toxin [Sphingobacteriaceae bacterium]|nr:MAG: type II toxin-antitoxin system RelE/ParE family toxin [Sphingobacteriaceae bacterium]
MVRIILSQIAKQDLKDIVNYIKIRSVHYAYLENQKIKEAIDQLIYQPLLGRIVPEQEDDTLREIIFRNYRIIYQFESKSRIQILTIHHHARLLNNNPAFDNED